MRSRCQEQPHWAALCRVNDGCGQRTELPASSRVSEEDSGGRTQPPASPSSGGRIAPPPHARGGLALTTCRFERPRGSCCSSRWEPPRRAELSCVLLLGLRKNLTAPCPPSSRELAQSSFSAPPKWPPSVYLGDTTAPHPALLLGPAE